VTQYPGHWEFFSLLLVNFNKRVNDLKSSTGRHFIPFYTHNNAGEDNYTLYIDTRTKDIVKAGAKDISPSKLTLLILVGYPIVQYFPVGIIPLNNIIAFISVCILVMVFSVLFGYHLSLRMIKDVRKVNLSAEKWNEYLEKGNKFYFRQLIFLLILFLFAITCFVLLYIYPSSWWFFGGILSSITAGPFITFFSKTRYLLYKNKLDINLNNGEAIVWKCINNETRNN